MSLMLTRSLVYRNRIQLPPVFIKGIQLRRFGENSDNDMEHLKSNPYFNKYVDKIAAAQKSSPGEFLEKVDSYFSRKLSEPENKSRGFSHAGTPKPNTSANYLKAKSLDSVLKVDSVGDLSADEIAQIWKVHHQHKDKVAAVIPANVYNTIFERSKIFPTFLYPLPRDQGYEFIMAQFNGHECHFTSLINYQAYKENAPECLTITHFTEFLHDKGIVLMYGDYNADVLNGPDACLLANQLQLFYTSPIDSTKYKLLYNFTNDSKNFKHMELINELENITSLVSKS